MTIRLLELANELRATLGPAGNRVIETAGWQTRGKPFGRRPRGAVRHWTAGPRTGYAPSLGVILKGRPEDNLPGPLATVYQARNLAGPDDVYVIASGIANHAGAGGWGGLVGNASVLGLEIEWSGPNETFPTRRKTTSELIIATLIRLGSGDPGLACEHREWAPRRKTDTNLNGPELRFRVAQILRPPTPTPKPPEALLTSSASVTFAGPDRHVAIQGNDHRAWVKIGAGSFAAFNGTGGRPDSALDPKSSPCITIGPSGLPRLWVSGANRKIHFTDRQPAGHWSPFDAFDGVDPYPDSLLAPGSSPTAHLVNGLWVVGAVGTDEKVYQYAEQPDGTWAMSALGGAVD